LAQMRKLMSQQPSDLRFALNAFQKSPADVEHAMRQKVSIAVRIQSNSNVHGFSAGCTCQSIRNALYAVNDCRIVDAAVVSLQLPGELLTEHKLFSNLRRCFRPGNLTPRRVRKNCDEGQARNHDLEQTRRLKIPRNGQGRRNSKKNVFAGEPCSFNVTTSNPESLAIAT
jgi:hypothetical protein